MQVLFAVVPLRVTSNAMLRAAPVWGRHGSVAAGIACNAAVLAAITAASAWPARGDRYIWGNSWRRLTGSWALFAVHVALVRAVFALRRRILVTRATMAGGSTAGERA